MSFCSKCGVKVPAESKFCHVCGSNIVKPIESVVDEYPELIEPIVHVVDTDHEEETPQNKGNEQDVEKNSEGNDDLRKFIGKNYSYYISKWESMEPSKSGSWNWSACLWTFFWMSYRKMYFKSFVIICVFLIVDFYISNKGVNVAFGLILFILLGWKGDFIYKFHVNRKIKEIYSKDLSELETNAQLEEQGGTSKLGLVGMYILFVLGVSLVERLIDSSSVNSIEKKENTVINLSKKIKTLN